MKKLILFIAILLSGCSAHDIALSIDNARAKLRTATSGLNQINYGSKGIISDSVKKICASDKENYVTGLITVGGIGKALSFKGYATEILISTVCSSWSTCKIVSRINL